MRAYSKIQSCNPSYICKFLYTVVLITEQVSHFQLPLPTHICAEGFSGSSVIKKPLVNTGDTGDASLIPGMGRSLGEGNVNPIQYSCLRNSRTEEPGRLQSQRVRHDLMTKQQQQLGTEEN